MSNLTILNTAIRQFDNLFSLNDLHRVGGGESKHKPTNFIRLDTTQELVAEIQKEDPTVIALQSNNGGVNRGTYACEEIALAYAMWISPKFHLIVLRAFLAMHKAKTQPKQLALPEPEKRYSFEFTEYELEQLVWLHCSHKQMNLLLGDMIEPLDAIGSKFSGIVYSHHHEYKRHHKATVQTIKRLIEPFKQSNRTNWIRAINLLNRIDF